MLKTPIAAAVLIALSVGASTAFAATAPSTSSVQGVQNSQQTGDAPNAQNTAQTSKEAANAQKAKRLEAVTVTGSLIPQTQIETSTPVTTITAEDIKARGFSTVAQALQATSFAVGGTQGAQSSGSFTQGAETLSFFGLPVGFTKYLINGRPMGNFPALYNGGQTFNNIAGIPADLVDHIDVLPGGQSSIYGSDAVAGVINIVLKKHIDAPTIDVRYGWHPGGGGATRRISLADSWSKGKFNILAGVQFESTQPIWGFDRALTRQYYQEGTSPATASRDFLVYSATKSRNAYYFQDPNNCSNVTGLFHGTEGLKTRTNSGQYCGTFYSPGYRTLQSDTKTSNAYTHATYDVNSNLQLYGDLLYKYATTKSSTGSNYTFWSTSDYGYIYDPNLKDVISLQRAFAPEDLGGYKSIESTQTDNAYFFTLGGTGTFGDSNWDYDLGLTHSNDKLENRNWQRFSGPIDAYFQSHVLGPQQGLDPNYGAYPVFTPNYAAFYQQIPLSDFRSFTGYTNTYSKTWDNLLRGQITNASLFTLPGGDAGIAVVAEGGNQGWDYSPDPRLLNGDVWGTTDVQGHGHRSRYALTSELRLPVYNWVTFDVSGRRDSYKVANNRLGKSTYNIGVEVRPFDSLLLRGRYGTAFKVPTLSDQFQGLSGFYSFVTDYYNCAKLGFTGANIGNCPSKYGSVQYFGQQAGNPDLKPINAKVWSYGVVWAPFERFSVSADYYHYSIKDKVNQQSADGLSLVNSLCLLGQLDASSTLCQQAASQVTRDAASNITKIFTPKVNVSSEVDNALVVQAKWAHNFGAFGNLYFNGSYSNILKHTQQQYPGDPSIDLLRAPNFSTDFKNKANASATWSKGEWAGTLYVNRYGKSPNYVARLTNGYSAKLAGSVAPWILYNASVNYSPTKALTLSVLVNNLFDAMPPEDHTYPGTSGSPYNNSNYNVYGRTIYLEANYKFGQGS